MPRSKIHRPNDLMKSTIVLFPILALFALSSPFSSARAQAPAPDHTADRRVLLEGVKTIGAPGVPGPLCLFGPNAFAVVAGKVDDTTSAPVVAASTLGRGRVVAFGHTSYLTPDTHGDSAKLLLNAILWASHNTNSLHVGVRKEAGLVTYLQQQGIAVEVLDGPGWELKLKNCQVLCCNSESLSLDHDMPLVDKFIREGGGFVSSSLGWGWLQLHPGRSLQVNHVGNRLLAPAGIAWADGTLSRTKGDGYSATESLSPYLNASSTLAAITANSAILTAGDLKQATWSVTEAVRNLPADDQILRPRLAALVKDAAGAVPTHQKPLRAKDGMARLSLTLQILEAQRAAPEQVQAIPASAVFPGSVPANAPRVMDRTVEVDTAVPAWHSTGLYAAPGEVIHVSIPSAAANKKFHVRIGAHSDRLWNKDTWSRAPEISVSRIITQPTQTLASGFGGLIYIEVPENTGLGVITVKISGAVEAPLFVLGKTNVEEWRRKQRSLPGPWAELANDKIILTVHSEAIRQLDNPDELMEFWARVLDADADLSTIPHQRKRPERIVADEQISAGYMHSGYPIMTWLDVEKMVVDVAKLKKDGSWGHFHELGHNHQQSDWTFDGTVEVTCNLYTLYCMENVCGLKAPQARDVFQPAKMEALIRKHLGTSAKFERWKADPFLALLSYYQLQQAFGWDTFKKVFAEYRALPKDQRPKNDDEKRDQWLIHFSRAAGKNLGPFYQAWGIPTSEKARATVADLPTWMPGNFPPK